ncbi:MAG TPA: hypothetical protein VFN56_05195 [Candidatus Saccharimonadales bacterium]|nr:hypothetical protein [Candidatus Saccharimonadales bacterium]
MRGRLAYGIAALALMVAWGCVGFSGHSAASTPLKQATYTTANATTVSVSYAQATTAGNLLIVVCSTNGAATITAPSGFSTAINESGDPAQAIFYKVASGTETSESCSFSAAVTSIIQIFEYTGIENVSPLDAVNTTTSSGSTTTGSSGTVTTLNANDLLFASITDDTSGGGITGTWSNSFINEQNGSTGGAQSKRSSFSSGDLSVSTAGSYSSTMSVPAANWRGQITAFKIAPTAVFSGDIVDGSGASVASPVVGFSATNHSFTCQSATGVLGTSTQKIRITNTTPTDKNGWNLTLAASSANWSDGAGHTYTYNNAAGSPAGCTSGQLTVNPTTATVTPESSPEYGCTTAGISTAAATALTGTTPATLVQAGPTASYYCYWDITGIGLTQTIPAAQTSGSYSISFTLTLTAL